MSLSYIGQQITIYGGFFILLSDIVGNGMNIFIFSSVRTYRTTPCSFYFLVGSIYNIIYILINVTSRIISAGYGIDLAGITIIWCKARQFCLITLSLISLSCSCLATIDQFLATSHSVHLRRYSKIEWAHRIVFVIIIVCCLHGIPTIFFYTTLPGSNKCTSINAVYAGYTSVFILLFLSTASATIMVIFGYMAYRNIRQTTVLAELQADRQLIKMTLIQVIFVVICIVPFGINTAYTLITNQVAKDTNRLLDESFVSIMFSLVVYFYYAVCLFIFCQINSHILSSIILFREVVTCF
jgi:hypothetical protein